VGKPCHGCTAIEPGVGLGRRPGGEQAAEIEQRIADRAQLPVHDRREARRVVAEHHVREMVVAVQDARREAARPLRLEPLRHPLDAGDLGSRPALELAVALELRAPARRLPLE
jgi:hypothetical protein